LSRIAILPGVQHEEVAGHLFEDQRLKAAEVEQTVVQGPLDGGGERTVWVGRLHADQAAQCPPAQTVVTLLESGGLTVQAVVMTTHHRLFVPRAAVVAGQ
jgi:hypothetical protein